jgi:hypothetical protein
MGPNQVIKHIRTALLVGLLLSATGAMLALAETAKSPAQIVAEFTVRLCWGAKPEKAVAKALDWQPFTGDSALIFGPADNKNSSLWGVQHEGQFMIVGVNRGEIRGKTTDICSVTTRERVTDVAPKILGAFLSAQKVYSETQAFEVVDIYQLSPAAGQTETWLWIQYATEAAGTDNLLKLGIFGR